MSTTTFEEKHHKLLPQGHGTTSICLINSRSSAWALSKVIQWCSPRVSMIRRRIHVNDADPILHQDLVVWRSRLFINRLWSNWARLGFECTQRCSSMSQAIPSKLHNLYYSSMLAHWITAASHKQTSLQRPLRRHTTRIHSSAHHIQATSIDGHSWGKTTLEWCFLTQIWKIRQFWWFESIRRAKVSYVGYITLRGVWNLHADEQDDMLRECCKRCSKVISLTNQGGQHFLPVHEHSWGEYAVRCPGWSSW